MKFARGRIRKEQNQQVCMPSTTYEYAWSKRLLKEWIMTVNGTKTVIISIIYLGLDICLSLKRKLGVMYECTRTFASKSPFAPFLRTMNWAGLSACMLPSGNWHTSSRWASPTAGDMYTLNGESGTCSSLNFKPIRYSPVLKVRVTNTKAIH